MLYKLYSLLVRINDVFITKEIVDELDIYDFGDFFIMKSHIENFFTKPTFSANFFITPTFSSDYYIGRKTPPIIIRE